MRRALAFRMSSPMRMLSRKMLYAEFLDWARLFAREPFDDRRCFDRPAAEIRHLYVNSHRKQGTPAIPLERFMPYSDKEPDAPAASIDAQVIALL